MKNILITVLVFTVWWGLGVTIIDMQQMINELEIVRYVDSNR